MKKRRALRWVLLVLALLALVALDQRLLIRSYTVDLDNINTPVRLAVLTDFHGGSRRIDAARLIEEVRQQAPDAVLMVGDMFPDSGDYTEITALITALAEAYPCYYVTGNHEYWTKEIDRVLDLVRQSGVTLLDLDSALLDVRGQRIRLCGIPDPYYSFYFKTLGQLKKRMELATAQNTDDVPTILLAHRPEAIEEYAGYGIDLVVSGHTHGGQVRLPGLVNGLCAPNQGWFPPYAGGEYRVDDMTLIVSRGLSTQAQWYIPRVFNRPELVVVDLK